MLAHRISCLTPPSSDIDTPQSLFPRTYHTEFCSQVHFPDKVLVGWTGWRTCASNLLQHATKLHSVRPSCSTCRRPVKSGKSTNLISATVHLVAGSAVCGIVEGPADVVRWGPSDTELLLRGLTTNRVASFARKEGNSARPKRGNHFTASQTVIVLSAVVQPERATAISPQSVCVNYL